MIKQHKHYFITIFIAMLLLFMGMIVAYPATQISADNGKTVTPTLPASPTGTVSTKSEAGPSVIETPQSFTQTVVSIPERGALGGVVDQPIVWLHFNETKPETKRFKDSSLLGHTGLCGGDACPLPESQGYANGAFTFDGKDDAVIIPLDLTSGTYTVIFWFKTACENCGLFSGVNGSNIPKTGYHIFLKQGTVCSQVWSSGKAEEICSVQAVTYNDNAWHQLAHTVNRKAETQILYLDGNPAAEGKIAKSGGGILNRARIADSANAGQRFLTGLLDEVELYNRLLDDAAIATRYANTLNPAILNSEYIVIPSTPTPANVVTLAAQAMRATEVAKTTGTYTPLPPNAVTPIVLVSTPRPQNDATATFIAQEATAIAYLYGAVTPTPLTVWTATPKPTATPTATSTPPPPPPPTATATPIYIVLQGDLATPWASPTPEANSLPMPQPLIGKILFISNRSGGPDPLIFKRIQDQVIYVFDPTTGELGVLTNRLFYDAAVMRDAWSADQRYRVFVKTGPVVGGKKFPTLYYYDYFYNVETQLTTFGHGASWDPVWSPTQEKIAFIANETGDSEIWVINRDGSNSTRLTETNEAYNAQQIGKDTFVPEVNGKPSWSPDGRQIVFWSNRGGTRQLWIMNADGSNPYTISTTGYDDWDPVWVKYTDPAHLP